MYQTLVSYIKDMLESITELNYIYDYENPNIEGYPAVTISFTDSDVEEIDTGNNFRTFGFDITVYQEIEKVGKGQSEGERIMRIILDKILEKFDKDITLGGNCIMCKPVPSTGGWVDKEMLHRAAKIKVNCLVKINRG